MSKAYHITKKAARQGGIYSITDNFCAALSDNDFLKCPVMLFPIRANIRVRSLTSIPSAHHSKALLPVYTVPVLPVPVSALRPTGAAPLQAHVTVQTGFSYSIPDAGPHAPFSVRPDCRCHRAANKTVRQIRPAVRLLFFSRRQD